jgi:hypothetical protein
MEKGPTGFAGGLCWKTVTRSASYGRVRKKTTFFMNRYNRNRLSRARAVGRTDASFRKKAKRSAWVFRDAGLAAASVKFSGIIRENKVFLADS